MFSSCLSTHGIHSAINKQTELTSLTAKVALFYFSYNLYQVCTNVLEAAKNPIDPLLDFLRTRGFKVIIDTVFGQVGNKYNFSTLRKNTVYFDWFINYMIQCADKERSRRR